MLHRNEQLIIVSKRGRFFEEFQNWPLVNEMLSQAQDDALGKPKCA